MNARQIKISVSANALSDAQQQDALCARLLSQQPHSRPLLERLVSQSRLKSKHGAFAAIQVGRCSACNMRIAIARVQQAKAGKFINCANCMRFLYFVS